MSPESLKSERCEWEIDKTRQLSKRLLPVVHINVPEQSVPENLRRLNYIYFSSRSFTKALSELAVALRTDIEWVREHTRLGELAERWAAHGYSEELLLRGVQLDEVSAWVGRRPDEAPEISATQTKFLKASRAAALTRVADEKKRLEELLLAQTQHAEAVLRARNRTRVGLVVSTLLTLIAGWKWFEEKQQQLRAATQQERAENALAVANKNADIVVFRVAKELRGNIGLPQSVARDILSDTVQLLEALPVDSNVNPLAQRNRAVAPLELGQSFLQAGDVLEAELVGSRVHDLFLRLQQIEPAPDQDFDITLSLELLANIDADFGRLKEAKEKQRQFYEIRKKLASFANAKSDWQMGLATTLESLATTLAVGEGKFAEATPLLREALAIRTAGLNNSPDDEDAIRACLESQERLAGILAAINERDEARTLASAASAERERLVRQEANSIELQREAAQALELLGEIDLNGPTPREAKVSFDEALSRRRQISNTDKAQLAWQSELSQVLAYVGHSAIASGEVDGALSAYIEALEINRQIERKVEENEIKQSRSAGKLTASALNRVAWYALLSRDFELAIQVTDRALTIDPGSPPIQMHRAHALLLLGRTDEARMAYAAIAPVETFSSARIPVASGIDNDCRLLRLAGLSRPEMSEMLAIRPKR
jgi:tetratricopeptide (TPR) repeat protein